jgi:Xaa-Pro aminopeptidase
MLSAVIAVVCDAMRPGATVADLDALVGEVLGGRGLGDHHVHGIGLGIGLRFEETPASRSSRPTGTSPCARG